MENKKKEFIEIEENHSFLEIFEVFKDVVYDPSEENIRNIFLEYKNDKEKTLFGYFLDKKLIGIMGIKNNEENIEILHFGIHPEYRGKDFGTELMDCIKAKNRTMVLSTDDDAIIFYIKYGYKYTEYYNEKYKKIRYNCEYKQ